MRRTAVSAAILLLAGYGSAYGQQTPVMPLVQKDGGVCVRNCAMPEADLLARLAKDFPMAPKTVQTVSIRPPAPIPGRRVEIGYDAGGLVDGYTARWRKHAAEGDTIAITNGCQSACTLVTAFVPKERICFEEHSWLAFHQATNRDTRQPEPLATQWMFDRYPIEIQAWLEGKGGVERLPYSNIDFWVLPAKTLWRMGYKRCD